MNKFIHNNHRQTSIFNEEFFMSSDDGKFSYILGKLKPGDRLSAIAIYPQRYLFRTCILDISSGKIGDFFEVNQP